MNWLAATIRALAGDVRALDVAVVDGAGNQLTGFDSSRPATSTTTTVPATGASTLLLAANSARRQYLIHNKSNQTAYVHQGAAATVAVHVHVIPKGGYYEGQLNAYTGALHVILSSGTGDVDVTEVTT